MEPNPDANLAINDPKHQRFMRRIIRAYVQEMTGEQLNTAMNFIIELQPDTDTEEDPELQRFAEECTEYMAQRAVLDSLDATSARPS